MITPTMFLIDAFAGITLGLIWYYGISFTFKSYHKRWFKIRFLGLQGVAHARAEYQYCHYLRKN